MSIYTQHGKIYFALIAFAFVVFSCGKDSEPDPVPVYVDPPQLADIPSDASLAWSKMTLYTLRFSSFNSPTYSSRSLGYMGLAMYESVVPGDPGMKSLEGQLPGLDIPAADVSQKYHWVISLNAGQRALLKLLYPAGANSHRFVHAKIDSLADLILDENSKQTEPEIVKRSVEFGEAVANAIYAWSSTDGGDKGYTRNFVPTFAFPAGESYWVPPQRGQIISQYPLHPYWGENRRFVPANEDIPVPEIVPFSADPESKYYKLYKAVYDKDKELTLEERESAAWWADDPTETFSPPGHSYHLASIAIELSSAKLGKAVETFARVGLAVGDSFITCWKAKYTYFNERPSSFVKSYIDQNWTPFWPEPPFPAFPSGHSIHSAAAATVLTDLYGDSFAFTDHVHEGHRRYDDFRFFDLTYPARQFDSFWDAADECAYSRFLGGIHTQQDNDVAQEMGKIVGANVNALEWHN
jgi:hypothetical protein